MVYPFPLLFFAALGALVLIAFLLVRWSNRNSWFSDLLTGAARRIILSCALHCPLFRSTPPS